MLAGCRSRCVNSVMPVCCHREALTVNGKTIWQNVLAAECYDRQVIPTFDEPFKAHAGIAVLRGNLAPDGAVHQTVRCDAGSAEASWGRRRV